MPGIIFSECSNKVHSNSTMDCSQSSSSACPLVYQSLETTGSYTTAAIFVSAKQHTANIGSHLTVRGFENSLLKSCSHKTQYDMTTTL